MKCTVFWGAIAAAQLFVGNDEARPVLNCVHIVVKDNNVIIEATDSCRAVRIETKAVESKPYEDGETILNLWNLKLNSKDKYVAIDAVDKTATITSDRFRIQLDRLDVLFGASYPNLGNAIPEKDTPAEPITGIGINAKFYYELGKAQKLLFGAKDPAPYLEFLGKKKAIVSACSNSEHKMTALIMPVWIEEKGLYLTHPNEKELEKNGAAKIAELRKKLKTAETLRDAAREREDRLRKEPQDVPKNGGEVDELKAVIEQLKAENERLKAEKQAEQTEQTEPTDDKAAEVVAQLIADNETIKVAGETPIAIYLAGIGANTPEHAAAKAAGCKFGNHKKYGKCWYLPKH